MVAPVFVVPPEVLPPWLPVFPPWLPPEVFPPEVFPPEELPPDYDKPNYREPSGKDVSEYALSTRRELRQKYLDAYASGKYDRTTLFPVKLPIMPQFRRIWCIDGKTTLQPDQYGMRFEDSIGMVADWRRFGEVWEVPYGSLLPQKVEGVLAAGRSSQQRYPDGQRWCDHGGGGGCLGGHPGDPVCGGDRRSGRCGGGSLCQTADDPFSSAR